MKSHYILIDLENVRPESLESLVQDHFKVIVFVGANQAKISLDIVAALQQFGPRARYVKVAASGRNALDFHLAFYMGRLTVEEPSATFHVISKDTGYDPLIAHLNSLGVKAKRFESVGDLPVTKVAGSATARERVAAVLARLEKMQASKPRRVATLSSTIASLFDGQLSEQEIAGLVQALAKAGHLKITGEVVSYLLPDLDQPTKSIATKTTPDAKA